MPSVGGPMPGFELRHAVCVITGAGSGVGRACAHSFAKRGAKVLVTDVRGDRAEQVAAELTAAGAEAAHLLCDVTQLADLEAARDLALERFGRVDLVMNNVGVLAIGPVEAIPLEGWQRIIDINLMGIVRSNLVFLPLLLAQGHGHIVNTASTAGLFPYGYDRLPYTTTKHAVVGLSESLLLYVRPKGIGVSCLCPAGVITNIAEQITAYGPRAENLRAPAFGLVEADVVGELVADGVSTGRFLILTAPEAAEELRDLGADLDGYLARQMEQP